METAEPDDDIDLSAGMVPSAPPQGPVPTPGAVAHPAGEVTGFDEATGLPIVQRQAAAPATARAGASQHTPAPAPPKGDNQEVPGTTDPESGRIVTQPTDDTKANQKLATEEMPEYRAGLKKAIQGIAGAKLAAVRARKDAGRLREKVTEEGQPPETVSDYGAAQISVDSPQARDAVIAAVKKQFPVIKEDDTFEHGDPEYGYRAHSLQVQMPNGASEELQIVPREVLEANDAEHEHYKDAREAEIDGNDADGRNLTVRQSQLKVIDGRNSGGNASARKGSGQPAQEETDAIPQQSSAGVLPYPRQATGQEVGGRVRPGEQGGTRAAGARQEEGEEAGAGKVPHGKILVRAHYRGKPS